MEIALKVLFGLVVFAVMFWPLGGLFIEYPGPFAMRSRWIKLIVFGFTALAVLPFFVALWADLSRQGPDSKVPLYLAWAPGIFLLVVGYVFYNLTIIYGTQEHPFRDYKYETSLVCRWCMKYTAMAFVAGGGFSLLYVGSCLASHYQ
jgi:hypothetical protein